MRWLALVITLGLAGCNHWVEVRTPMPELLEDFPPPRLRLATSSGQSVVMIGARFYRDTLAGLVERQSSGEAVMSALIGVSIKRLVPGSLAVQDVLRVEARRPDPAATAAAVVVGAAGVVVAAVLIAKGPGLLPGNRERAALRSAVVSVLQRVPASGVGVGVWAGRLDGGTSPLIRM